MARALFVSDIHIKSPEDPKHGLFLQLLNKARQNPPEHLFLVGDIFDLWIADRKYFVGRYARIIASLRALKESGTQIHYFEGNHDLDLKPFWQRTLGAEVYDRAAYFEIDRQVIRVEHGDQMDPEDKGYLFLRWFLRTPFMRLAGRWLPNAAVKWIGERASRASREYTSQVKTSTDDRSVNVIRKHAKRAFKNKPFHIFVSGHLHVLEDSWQETQGRRFRCFGLGTWLNTPFMLLVEGDNVRLKRVDDFVR